MIIKNSSSRNLSTRDVRVRRLPQSGLLEIRGQKKVEKVNINEKVNYGDGLRR